MSSLSKGRLRGFLAILLVLLGSLICLAQVSLAEDSEADSEELEIPDVDMQIGKVLLTENVKAYAVVLPFSLNPDWETFFYTMDNHFKPVSILKASPFTYKNLRMFYVVDGEVKNGDIIFLKQISPYPVKERAQEE